MWQQKEKERCIYSKIKIKKIYKQENIKGSKHYTTFAAHYKAAGELSQIVIEHHTVPVKITLGVL